MFKIYYNERKKEAIVLDSCCYSIRDDGDMWINNPPWGYTNWDRYTGDIPECLRRIMRPGEVKDFIFEEDPEGDVEIALCPTLGNYSISFGAPLKVVNHDNGVPQFNVLGNLTVRGRCALGEVFKCDATLCGEVAKGSRIPKSGEIIKYRLLTPSEYESKYMDIK